MNRQQALEWTVNNIPKWPTNVFDRNLKSPGNWYWVDSFGIISLIEKGAPDMGIITQSGWLAATDNMQVKDEQ